MPVRVTINHVTNVGYFSPLVAVVGAEPTTPPPSELLEVLFAWDAARAGLPDGPVPGGGSAPAAFPPTSGWKFISWLNITPAEGNPWWSVALELLRTDDGAQTLGVEAYFRQAGPSVPIYAEYLDKKTASIPVGT